MKQVGIFLIFLMTLISSCSSREMKFDKTKWRYREDAGQPSSYRKRMLKDLTTNYKLTGIKYSQLIEFLGEPNLEDSTSLGYDIVIDYGHDIDPVYIKTLKFTFSEDSTITSFKVNNSNLQAVTSLAIKWFENNKAPLPSGNLFNYVKSD